MRTMIPMQASSFPEIVTETPQLVLDRSLRAEASGVPWKLSLERHLGAEAGTAGSLRKAEVSSLGSSWPSVKDSVEARDSARDSWDLFSDHATSVAG